MIETKKVGCVARLSVSCDVSEEQGRSMRTFNHGLIGIESLRVIEMIRRQVLCDDRLDSAHRR